MQRTRIYQTPRHPFREGTVGSGQPSLSAPDLARGHTHSQGGSHLQMGGRMPGYKGPTTSDRLHVSEGPLQIGAPYGVGGGFAGRPHSWASPPALSCFLPAPSTGGDLKVT